MKYKPRAGRTYRAARRPRPPVTPVKAQLKTVRLDVHRLSERERAALLAIYHFSSTRRFRYGLNERYVPDPSVLESLREKGLAFYKRAHGYRYWLPMELGREIVESLP